MSLPSWRLSALLFAVLLAGCSAIPGSTQQEQVHNVDQLLERTLADVKRQHPQAADELTRAVGYVVMDNTLTKVPVFGAGSGYGVAIENASGARTYLRMRRFDFGAGWGVRHLRPVLIFFDAEKFHRFANGDFEIRLAAEASAKVDQVGLAGTVGGGVQQSEEKGYVAYLMTDVGVSATWALGFIRVKPVELKKAD
ncbi:MAG: hypothetical protein REI12_12395 [Pedobacter sp.]|nr:hypothetical protein [Pedobacter sp.]